MKYKLLKEAALRELAEETLPMASPMDDVWQGPKSLDDLRRKEHQYDKELEDNPRNVQNPSYNRLVHLCASGKVGDAIYETLEHLEYEMKHCGDPSMRDGIKKGVNAVRFLYSAHQDGNTKYNWGDV